MNGKHFVVATLLAAVMLTVAFVPVASQQVPEYDPWLDVNEDGKIDIKDLATAAKAYGALGDPTKNVTITRHATKLIKAADAVSVGPGNLWSSGWVTVDGYSKMTVNIYFAAASSNWYRLEVKSNAGTTFYADTVVNFGFDLVKSYDVMNQQIGLVVYNNSAGSGTLYVDIYLMA